MNNPVMEDAGVVAIAVVMEIIVGVTEAIADVMAIQADVVTIENMKTQSFFKYIFSKPHEAFLCVALHSLVVFGFLTVIDRGIEQFPNIKVYSITLVFLALVPVLYWVIMLKHWVDFKNGKQ